MYVLITEIRNLLFKVGILKSHKLSVPVVSVGNLSMGGTGKTPFVMSLISELEPYFKNIVVISRGYGRKSKGPRVVSFQGEILLDVRDAGDEPFLIAQNCKNCSVIVAEKRVAAWNLVKAKNPDIIILDDGFQHQYIKRDLDILLENGHYPTAKDFIFPIGRLRELKKNINRADIVVTTKAKYKLMPKSNLFCETKVLNVDTLLEKEYNLISGIANPNEFINTCKNNGIKVNKHFVYKDHMDYSEIDFSGLIKEPVLTTEKDYMKLKDKFEDVEVLKIKFNISKEIINKILLLKKT